MKQLSKLLNVLKPVNAVLLILAIVSVLSYGMCELFINPLPKVDNDSIIRDFKPMFCTVHGIYTDNNGSFYVHTTKCIMRFDSEWNYQYSYIYPSSVRSMQALVITDEGLLIGPILYKGESSLISFSGEILYTTFGTEPATLNAEHNKSVYGPDGTHYELQPLFFCSGIQRIVDDSGNVIWHSSYIGGIIFLSVWWFVFLTFFLFIFRLIAEDYRNVPIIKICIKLKRIIIRKNDNTELTEDDSS